MNNKYDSAKGAASWDRLAPRYDHLWVQKYSLGPTRRMVLEYIRSLKPDLHSCLSFLDVGCGTGQLMKEISDTYTKSQLIGVDNSPSMIDEASVRGIGRSLIMEIDISRPDCWVTYDSSVDIITCCHSFPYYANKEIVLSHLSRLLKDSGSAIFVQASVNGAYDSIVMHFVEKTAEKAEYLSVTQFRDMVSPYFKIYDEFKIKERFFMPSICGFVMRKLT